MFLLLKLYLVFLKIGCVSFGGGYAMLPFIQQEIVESNGWLTTSEFMDVFAISQITPGPIAINAATFIGFRYLGLLGATFATIGIISGPLVFMSIIHHFLKKYKESAVFNQIFTYLRPVTLALILSAGYSAAKTSLIDIKSIILFILSLLILKFTKIHPVLVILGFGALGILIF